MRQAGRYMADYRELRRRYSLLDICRQPELAVAVTLQPVDVIEVDAAILFSDLLVPFTPMGLDFDFVKGEGRRSSNPIRSAPTSTACGVRASRGARARARDDPPPAPGTGGRVPLIGFGGAPFTLAAYAIEGGPSTSYARTKAFMYSQPDAWHRLCDASRR
jgi:uroporphyrinogen decarboxylase